MHTATETEGWDPFPPAREDDQAERRSANRAIGLSAVGLGITGLVELAFALLSGSVGLLGDALHNLSDVSTSAVVWVGFRISKRPATQSHPYGYDRAEDLAGLGVALVIWASAVFAAIASYHKLVEHGRTTHLGLAMGAAVVGMGGNQLVARYKLRVGRRIQSATLLADAKHSWLDSISSLGALVGLVGVAAGARWGDPVAGFAITLFIAHVGWEVTGEILGHLMDSVDPELVVAAERAALSVPGVSHAHVRARWIGRTLLVEIEGYVPATSAIEAAEATGRDVEAAVLASVPEARAVVWTPRSMPLAPAVG
ncbi:MAG TPA: cation diffusion facilitator family transporter [Acidimicrobiales bacterium]|nr:cation diffusion facilitator family transporter [Acidimicrobiales bacterium]